MDRKAFTLIELLVVIAIIGILASMLLPTLAKAKKKANRMKCASTMGSIQKALAAFAGEHEQAYPWMMTSEDLASTYGIVVSDAGDITGRSEDWATRNDLWRSRDERFCEHNGADIRYLFLETTLRKDLSSSKSLMSPSDPRVKRTNDLDVQKGIFKGWARHWWKSAQLHQRAISYGVHKSGDDMKGAGSITMVTRNFEGETARANSVPNNMNNWSLSWAKTHRHLRMNETWASPQSDKRVYMSGLDEGQGQIAFADGQVQQAENAQFQSALKKNTELDGGLASAPTDGGEVTRGSWY